MTARTCIRRIGKIAVVTCITIIGNRNVCTNNRINRIVIEGRRRPCGFGMARSTICRELCGGVVGVGGRVIICGMATKTGIGCVIIIAVVAGRTVIGNDGMRTIQSIIIIVNSKGCRLPARLCRMTTGTIGWQIQRNVVGIGRLIKIGRMAGRTLGWCTDIPGGMTFDAIGCKVCPGERETGGIVVKTGAPITCWVTSQTSRTFINIPVYPIVHIIGFRIDVTGGARKYGKIGGIGMTINTLCPLSQVLPAINREKLSVVLQELGRHPIGIGRMALRTIIGEPSLNVVGACCTLKIRLVTGHTIRGCVSEVTANVAFGTICYFMALGEWEKVVFYFIRSPIRRKNIVTFLAIC